MFLKHKPSRFFVALLFVAKASTAEPMYLCEAYRGGAFWSKTPCSQQQAVARETYDVPRTLSFTEQVAQAERARQAARYQPAPGPTLHGINSSPVAGSEEECARHKERIKELEQMRQQIRPAMSLDGIALELNTRRSRVSELRCR